MLPLTEEGLMNLDDPRQMDDPWNALEWEGCKKVEFAHRFREMIDAIMLEGKRLLALEYVHVFRRLVKKIGDLHLICQGEVMLAVAIKDLGNYSLAFEQFDLAKSVCDCCNCQALLANRMAIAEFSRNEIDKSLQNLNDAVEMCQEPGTDLGLYCEILASRAALLRFLDHHQRALNDTDAAAKLANKATPRRILESLTCGTLFLASVMPKVDVGRAWSIVKYLRSLLIGSNSDDSKRLRFFYRWAYGLLYWRIGNSSKAIEFLVNARNQILKFDPGRLHAKQNLAAVRADLLMVRACSPNQALQFPYVKRELPELVKDLDLVEAIVEDKDKISRRQKIIKLREGIPSPFPLISPDCPYHAIGDHQFPSSPPISRQ